VSVLSNLKFYNLLRQSPINGRDQQGHPSYSHDAVAYILDGQDLTNSLSGDPPFKMARYRFRPQKPLEFSTTSASSLVGLGFWPPWADHEGIMARLINSLCLLRVSSRFRKGTSPPGPSRDPQMRS